MKLGTLSQSGQGTHKTHSDHTPPMPDIWTHYTLAVIVSCICFQMGVIYGPHSTPKTGFMNCFMMLQEIYKRTFKMIIF